MEWVTNGSYLSLWEGCLANKDIKPVGQYLQAAAASTCRWLHMYFSNVQTCLMPRWRTVGCPHHRRPLQGVCRFIPSAFCSKAATPRVINKTSQCSRGHSRKLFRSARKSRGRIHEFALDTHRPLYFTAAQNGEITETYEGDWQVLLFCFVFLLILGVYSRTDRLQAGCSVFCFFGGGLSWRRRSSNAKLKFYLLFFFVVVALIQTV